MLFKGFGNFILQRKFNSINNAAIRCFTNKTNKLRDIISNEIKYEKDNYQSVDENEISQFKNSTKFELIEKDNKTKMELRKKEGNYIVAVNFNARPPINQEEEQPNQDKSKFKKDKKISEDVLNMFFI